MSHRHGSLATSDGTDDMVLNTRKNKYGVSSKAERTFKNIVFASKAEMNRYVVLLALEKAGVITGLKRQPSFDLVVNDILCGCYLADFWYEHADGSGAVVEDVKGVRTPVYNLKKKLVEAIYGFEITEVK